MIGNASNLISRIGRWIEIDRYVNGSYDGDGIWQTAPPEKVKILAAIQSAKPEEIQELPENRRTQETLKLYVLAMMITGSVENQIQADQFVHNGKRFEVQSVTDWSAEAGYWKVLATKMEQ